MRLTSAIRLVMLALSAAIFVSVVADAQQPAGQGPFPRMQALVPPDGPRDFETISQPIRVVLCAVRLPVHGGL